MLRRFGVKKGEVVINFMPLCPEVTISMLACCRIGAIHCNLYLGLSPKVLSQKFQDLDPKLILYTSCAGIPQLTSLKEIVNEGIKLSGKIIKTIIVQRKILNAKNLMEGSEFDFYDELNKSEKNLSYEILNSNDPWCLMFT